MLLSRNIRPLAVGAPNRGCGASDRVRLVTSTDRGDLYGLDRYLAFLINRDRGWLPREFVSERLDPLGDYEISLFRV